MAASAEHSKEIVPSAFCAQNVSMLLSTDHQHIIPELEIVTNELVLELCKFKDQHNCTYKDFYAWIKSCYGKKWPEEQTPTHQAIAKSAERLKAKVSKLKKQHDTNEKVESIATFFQQEYSLPKLGYSHGQVVHFSPLRQLLPSSQQKDHHEDLRYAELKKKLYASTRNANKRLNRREEKIQQQKDEIQHQLHQINSYEKKVKGLECQLSKIRSNLDRVNHRALYWKKKVGDAKDLSSTKRSELKHEIEKLRDELSVVSLDNAEMSDTLESILSSEEITTFEGGKYILMISEHAYMNYCL